FHQGNQVVHTLSTIKKVLSTIGSGDCLLAGIIYGFIKNFSFEKIAKTGAACGAANCMREDLGMLHKTDVFDLLENQTETFH
ncbi:MAG: PfkB family carbohydrate kinase, partial [Cyclobacteriaceae bacterium]|nr:PfkB family carbohydrate kinase [Cyclobacteriaceae bacterium]